MIAATSLSVIVVVTELFTTVAVELPSVTPNVSLPSTTTSCVVGIEKFSSVAPVDRLLPDVLVAVTVTTPLAPVLIPESVTPVAAVRLPDTSAEKSVPSVAVPDAVSTVNVTL